MQHSQVIRLERHERIAQLIERDVGMLIDRWSRRAAAEQPDGGRGRRDTLVDDLSQFLHALAKSLDASSAEHVCQHQLPAYRHGEQRWQTGWSLPELVRDYQLLRTVTLEYLDEMLERPLRLREVLALDLAFDEAIGASVGMYVASREEAARHSEGERLEHERAEEERLRQQAETLREIDHRKDEFLAILGHELRNPLAPIRNVLQVLRLKPPDQQTLLWSREVVERQVEHMTRLVDDLLDVTRIARGKIELRLERLDLARVVRETAEDRRGAIESSGLQLQLDVPDTPVTVRGDAVRLAQVVGNLVHNALKFTGSGGQITLRLQCDEAAQRAVLSVRDTGAGIEPAELPHVFETFRQGERSRHQSRGGLGLGLALVKGLVELHGGEVRAASAGAGQGSEFTVHVPLARG